MLVDCRKWIRCSQDRSVFWGAALTKSTESRPPSNKRGDRVSDMEEVSFKYQNQWPQVFTSEGCSSCPPADALLARLSEAPLAGNVQLIALEEHVDYWDDQGWADPFSSRDWTSRQYVYSGVL